MIFFLLYYERLCRLWLAKNIYSPFILTTTTTREKKYASQRTRARDCETIIKKKNCHCAGLPRDWKSYFPLVPKAIVQIKVKAICFECWLARFRCGLSSLGSSLQHLVIFVIVNKNAVGELVFIKLLTTRSTGGGAFSNNSLFIYVLGRHFLILKNLINFIVFFYTHTFFFFRADPTKKISEVW